MVFHRRPHPRLPAHHRPGHGPLPAKAEAALAVEDRDPESEQRDEAVAQAGVLEDEDPGAGAS